MFWYNLSKLLEVKLKLALLVSDNICSTWALIIVASSVCKFADELPKTISDNDRRLVDTIVGGIDIIRGDADIDLLKSKLGRLFKQITASKQDEIDEAYSNLEKFGIKVDREGAGTLGTNMILGEDNVYRFVAKETT